MNVKAIIEQFSTVHLNQMKNLSVLRKVFREEDQLWKILHTMDSDFFNYGEGFSFLADSMQLVNDNERQKEIELEDIKKIYELLVKYYPGNIQYKIDLLNFLDAVMGEEEATLTLIEELDNQLDNYSKQVEKIKNEVMK